MIDFAVKLTKGIDSRSFHQLNNALIGFFESLWHHVVKKVIDKCFLKFPEFAVACCNGTAKWPVELWENI